MTYTDEKHVLILLSLLKAHDIKKFIISPGSNNIPISGSVQSDSYFEVYSAVDERSAAYIAVGMAENSGEPVVLSCTGATASRNYMPGLTEAYYRKLPVIAITSFNGNENIGHLVAQNIDRTRIPNDVAIISVHLPVIRTKTDHWECNTLVNKALIESKRNGGGPVHINISSLYTGQFNVKSLPNERVIHYLNRHSKIEGLGKKKIGIFVGSHRRFTDRETHAIKDFCETRNAVVFCDHTSSYKGEFRIQSALVSSNTGSWSSKWKDLTPDLIIHIGEVSGDYSSTKLIKDANQVWRVSEDGIIRDLSRKLSVIYEGTIEEFFTKAKGEQIVTNSFHEFWSTYDQHLRANFPKVPFSNIWIASKLFKKLPKNCKLLLAILNSLRSWNFFELDKSIEVSSNVGGFGIDGCLSTAIGSALSNLNELHFVIIGDLAFFYDLNSLANRHLPRNLRILIVNNGGGIEFKNSSHIASKLKLNPNSLIAAGGHFNSGNSFDGNINNTFIRRDKSLAKVWCEGLGFSYMSAVDKTESLSCINKFIRDEMEQPMILECFTNDWEESEALEITENFDKKGVDSFISTVKKIMPNDAKRFAKNILRK